MVSTSNRVDYSPIIDRPKLEWPNGARVALWVAPNVEHYEYLPVQDGPRDPWPRTPYPDVQHYSYREYPEDFARVVSDFIRGGSGPAG